MKIRLHLLSCLVFLVAVVPLYTQDVEYEAEAEKPGPPPLKTDTSTEKTGASAKKTDTSTYNTDTLAEKTDTHAEKTEIPAEKYDVAVKETDILTQKADTAAQESEVSSRKAPIQKKGKYIFGALKTTVYTDVATVQSTVYMYCVVGQATSPACTGKKRRRRNTLNQEIDILSSDKSLDGLSTSLQTTSELKSEGNDGKLTGFVVWTTSRTTTTVTVLTTNTATSIRLSILCTAADVVPPSIGCLTIAAG